jgi:hypothetical protein
MSVIATENAKQAAYNAAVTAAQALPHQPPSYRKTVSVTRNDLQGSPATVVVGAVGYNAVTQKIVLETISSSGDVTGSIAFEADAIDAFSQALLELKE